MVRGIIDVYRRAVQADFIIGITGYVIYAVFIPDTICIQVVPLVAALISRGSGDPYAPFLKTVRPSVIGI